MRVAILNWSGGENDPYTYFSRQMQLQLQSLGHDTHIVPLDAAFRPTLYRLHQEARIDLAFTWVGLGSDARPEGQAGTLWELLGIPLICLHGDHAAYNPPNHHQSSPYLFHLYTCQQYASDANRLLPRAYPALFVPPVNLIWPVRAPSRFAGEYFVFPKNLQHIEELRLGWQKRYPPSICQVLEAGAECITQSFLAGGTTAALDVLLEFLPATIADAVRAREAPPEVTSVVFALISELDRVYRNVASAFVIDTLEHVPIRVNGRGWERQAARGNPNHTFRAFGNVADGAAQFRSAYGILDVAQAADAFHDRTMRAMRHGCGFLACTHWRTGEPIREGFSDLFFGGNADDLAAKAERVRHDPEAHRRRVADFTTVFDAVFSFADFMERIRAAVAGRGLSLP